MNRYFFVILAALLLLSCAQRKIVISDVNAAGTKASAVSAVDSSQKK